LQHVSDVLLASRHSLLPVIALAACTWSVAARAESSDAVPDTFEYTTPTEKNYLRAVLELGALTTVGVVWYAIDVRQGEGVGYRWEKFEKKLSGSAIGHDDNAFGTNFRGHVLGGGSARSNHLSILESFGFALAGTVLWEYFGEINEVVSFNDLIVTPFSGIGLGEPLKSCSESWSVLNTRVIVTNPACSRIACFCSICRRSRLATTVARTTWAGSSRSTSVGHSAARTRWYCRKRQPAPPTRPS